MSRGRTAASPLERLCTAGRLAAIDIGLETIVLPATLAHKLLPLLEQAATADGAYGGHLSRGPIYLNAMVQPAYRLLGDGQAIAGPRPARDDDGGA